METLIIFLGIIIGVIVCVFAGNYWGEIAEQAARNKGYRGSEWYWKGFWKGERALHEVWLVPDLSDYTNQNGKSHLTEWAEEGFVIKKEPRKVDESEWLCKKCDRVNQSYIGTCACGNTKRDNNDSDTDIKQAESEIKNSEITKPKAESEHKWIEEVQKEAEKADSWLNNVQSKQKDISIESEKLQGELTDVRIPQEYVDEELINIEKVKQYKELLDMGIISFAEYEKKRKELLNL